MPKPSTPPSGADSPVAVAYHYTSGYAIPKILANGVIRAGTRSRSKRELAAVWFSTNPVWEPSATKAKRNSSGWYTMRLKEMKRTWGLTRIVVPLREAPYTWYRYVVLSGIPPRVALQIEHRSRQEGAKPEEWRAAFGDVPYVRWLAVEVWERGRWRPWTRAHAERFGTAAGPAGTVPGLTPP